MRIRHSVATTDRLENYSIPICLYRLNIYRSHFLRVCGHGRNQSTSTIYRLSVPVGSPLARTSNAPPVSARSRNVMNFLPGSSGNTLTTAAGWNQQPVIAGILRGDSDLAHVFIGRRPAEIGFTEIAGVARGRQEPEEVETHDRCVDRLKYAGGSPAVSSLENWVNRKCRPCGRGSARQTDSRCGSAGQNRFPFHTLSATSTLRYLTWKSCWIPRARVHSSHQHTGGNVFSGRLPRKDWIRSNSKDSIVCSSASRHSEERSAFPDEPCAEIANDSQIDVQV